ncbi:hypothetical protein ACHAP8_012255 [Fusarium lateritium]
MSIRLVKAYLLRAFNVPLPDVEILLEKATPAIALSKADDNEISQSDIDEFLHDNEEIWEDFSDDEPAGDL